MKKYVLLLLSITNFTFSFSQQIKVEVNQIDDFSGSRIIRTENPINKTFIKMSDYIDKDKVLLFYLSYFKTKEGRENYTINMIVNSTSIQCLSEYEGKCIILFDNGETMEISQISDTDCGQYRTRAIYVLAKRDEIENNDFNQISLNNLEKLKNNLIRKIRVYGTNRYIDCELKENKKDIFIQHINAINEAK